MVGHLPSTKTISDQPFIVVLMVRDLGMVCVYVWSNYESKKKKKKMKIYVWIIL